MKQSTKLHLQQFAFWGTALLAFHLLLWAFGAVR